MLFLKNWSPKKQKPKVFCIGFNKTGTTTLGFVLEQHGYLVADENEAQKLVKAYKERRFTDIIKFSAKSEAFQDAPFSWPFTFLFLEQAYPDAKFILSIRDSAEQWYKSLTRFHSKLFSDGISTPSYEKMLSTKRPHGNNVWDNMYIKFELDKEEPYKKDTLIGYYERHNEMVIDYFRFKNNLLVINVASDSAYNDFCRFLDLRPIFDKFPIKNKTS